MDNIVRYRSCTIHPSGAEGLEGHVNRVHPTDAGAAPFYHQLHSCSLVRPDFKDGAKAVVLAWTRNVGEADDHTSIVWDFSEKGLPFDTDDRVFALGSAAFAISIIQGDVDDEDSRANLKFLRDPKNLNFVGTPRGKLGDLLDQAGCHLINPTYVLPVIDGWIDGGRGFVRLQVSVNCPFKLDSAKHPNDGYYNLRALVSLNLANGTSQWVPTSFLATRIWNGVPGHWDEYKLTIQDQVFDVAKAAAALVDLPSYSWLDVARVIELRNSGHALPASLDSMNALQSAGLLLKLQNSTHGTVTPTVIEEFLRHAGLLATTMTDTGIVDSVPLFAQHP